MKFIALMTTISKKQTLINSLCSKNFAECLMSSFFMIDDMTDSAKKSRSFLNCQIHVSTKNAVKLPYLRNNQTLKFTGSLISIIENGGAI